MDQDFFKIWFSGFCGGLEDMGETNRRLLEGCGKCSFLVTVR